MVKINKQLVMMVKKKRNIFILSVCSIVSFILYQLYFFIAISSVNSSSNKILNVLDHDTVKEMKVRHHRHEADKYVNEDGILRGVLFVKMPQYRQDSKNQFQCLYSKESIPYQYVNDDYCDCEDSTDEPSTSACVNGTFYCNTQHPNKKMLLNKVPSNKVNDGICDCCDGSDEWLHDSNQKLLSQSTVDHYRLYVTKCVSNCYK